MIHGHGGNIFAAAEALGCRPEDITDMSANINPLGPMPGLLEHLGQNIENVCRLPEVDAYRAVKAYACWQGIDENRIIAGAGTTEFLYLLPRALGIGSAIVAGPTYSDYADAMEINNVKYNYFMRKSKNRFKPDLNMLKKQAEDADAVFFCNPNNPTAEFTDTEQLASLVRSMPETLFAIDESYLPFVRGPENKTMAHTGLSNLVVLQSLSKIHCIPGLRVGFCVAPEPAAEKIRKYLPPWSVNSQAQAAVLFIVQNSETAEAHAEKTRKYLQGQRAEIYKRLSDIPGLEAFDSDTTFMLMRAESFNAAEIADHMLASRLLIRDCSNFQGMDEHFFRISLKAPESNDLAARVIAEFAEDGRRRTEGGGRRAGDK
ncbi:MAG: aminotransferase class I/II-fold pyridoxal phosphate-dependent enzyme [Desulfobacteraceae bacterium]|nr:aminotransferase class I/II-fold pyridoxal phosphate-dependent enzyme [Desulfobacteraceae bacterium]